MAAGFQFVMGAFKGKEADPEVTRERLDKYLENMDRIFSLNRRVNPQTGDKVEFDDQEKKSILCVEEEPKYRTCSNTRARSRPTTCMRRQSRRSGRH